MSLFSYQRGAALVAGVGLMGQHAAQAMLEQLPLSELILADAAAEVRVGDKKLGLDEFASSLRNPNGVKIATATVNAADEAAVYELFSGHRDIRYLLATVGISPRPLTPPEDLSREDVVNACDINLWGPMNLLKQGIKAKAFARGARGVIILSTSGTVGSEGRASAAYEVSKGGLLNFLDHQARHFVEKHGIVLNGIAPSPLKGLMAAQNPVSAARLEAVERAMPLGELTQPKHISAASMYFLSEECWCVGEVLTLDGGYTKHRPIYGAL